MKSETKNLQFEKMFENHDELTGNYYKYMYIYIYIIDIINILPIIYVHV